MITKQFVEKQIALEKQVKTEYKEHKDKDKDKEKEKEKEKDKEIFKDIHKEKDFHKEFVLEYPQVQTAGFEASAQAAAPAAAPAVAPEATVAKVVDHKQIYEKYTVKEYKVEKVEYKEYKNEIKEFAKEAYFEGKPLVDTVSTLPGGDPYEQRLSALESAVSQLSHFIPAELRPDLSQGALKQEPDAAKPAPAETTTPKDAKK